MSDRTLMKRTEYMIINVDRRQVIEDCIKTLNQAVKRGRELSWLPGEIKIVQVIADAKEV